METTTERELPVGSSATEDDDRAAFSWFCQMLVLQIGEAPGEPIWLRSGQKPKGPALLRFDLIENSFTIPDVLHLPELRPIFDYFRSKGIRATRDELRTQLKTDFEDRGDSETLGVMIRALKSPEEQRTWVKYFLARTLYVLAHPNRVTINDQKNPWLVRNEVGGEWRVQRPGNRTSS